MNVKRDFEFNTKNGFRVQGYWFEEYKSWVVYYLYPNGDVSHQASEYYSHRADAVKGAKEMVKMLESNPPKTLQEETGYVPSPRIKIINKTWNI